jgi:aminoglycoside phosphotransferase (APT) family kinase protein
MSPPTRDDELAPRLTAFLASETGLAEEAVRVSGLRRMAGGASRELWALDLGLEGAGGPERLELVLRRDPAGREHEGDRGLEYRVLAAAGEAGLPVPRVHWCCTDPGVLGSSFFLMERVEGETIPRRILRDPAFEKARGRLVAQLGEALAGIHALDTSAPGLAGLGNSAAGVDSARGEVARLAEGLRQLAVEPHPVLDLAERWLLERAPQLRRRVLVHGDYRLGNVVCDGDGLRAVLDWELAHLGDPVEDLGWLCVRAWRFGRDELPAAGLGTRQELVAAYEAAGGDAVDPASLRFWEACGNFKLALVFVTQARVFLDGVASVELASLGRRIAEAERELIALMDGEEGR